jgi:formate dehydrogenase major subunit
MTVQTISRRTFLKAGVGVAGAAVSVFGFDVQPAAAQARSLKIERTTETRSVCPYCAVGCSVIIHTLGDRARNVTGSTVVHVEGDPDSPINRGTLCSKGATLKDDIVNERRLTKVLYRAPGADSFEEKSWDWAIDRIAHLIKETRDSKLITKDYKGRTINALTAMAVVGGCTDSNENNYLIQKAFRAGLSVIPVEQQARI